MVALASITLALVAPINASPGVTSKYTVRQIEQKSFFAGRLGRRVETRLEVADDRGESKWVRLPRQHTLAGPVRSYFVGETIRLPRW